MCYLISSVRKANVVLRSVLKCKVTVSQLDCVIVPLTQQYSHKHSPTHETKMLVSLNPNMVLQPWIWCDAGEQLWLTNVSNVCVFTCLALWAHG